MDAYLIIEAINQDLKSKKPKETVKTAAQIGGSVAGGVIGGTVGSFAGKIVGGKLTF